MKEIQIRKMQTSDIEDVYEIERTSFSRPWSIEGVFTYLLRDDALCLVAEMADEIVGFCIVVSAADESELINVAVETAYRGMHIGKTLIDEAVRILTENGQASLFLEVREGNDPARKMYDKIGFVESYVRKNYYENPIEDAIVMVKSLD